MILEALALAALILAAIPAVLAAVNLWLYRQPPRQKTEPAGGLKGAARAARQDEDELPAVSVLIPARDEEGSIRACVEAALASEGVDVEVVVMDDHSLDATPEIVRWIAQRDPRVRLETAPALPAGWNGKQHACAALARVASHPVLAFLDADVRLTPHGLRRMVDFLDRRSAGLVSGIPWQRTQTWAEKLVVPLIHFVLLGFLPMLGMRWSKSPAFAAGCGQLFVARRDAYLESGGHAAIRASRHDGLKLPRAFRAAGWHTDLADATPVAECRMYHDAREVFAGFAKNATEGMAAPAAIFPWTLLLLGGQVLPLPLLAVSLLAGSPQAVARSAAALVLAYGCRALLTLRFRQSWLGALGHPIGVAAVVGIQWHAWWQERRGRAIAWKGRLQAG